MKRTPTSAAAPTVIHPLVESFEAMSRKLRFMGGGGRAGRDQTWVWKIVVAAESIWLRICEAKSMARLAFSTAVIALAGSVACPVASCWEAWVAFACEVSSAPSALVSASPKLWPLPFAGAVVGDGMLAPSPPMLVPRDPI